ncbi:fungal-specific transcription factor domain-containing protein [Aspergillus californicus]
MTRSRYVKTLEDRLRKTESLLKAAGILVEPTNFDDVSDVSEDHAEDDSTTEDEPDDSTRPQREFGEQDAACSASVVERNSPTQGTKRSYDSSSPPKVYERRRSNTGKSGPPVYRPEKGNSLYFGRSTPLSILTREGVEWIKTRSGETNSLDTLLSNTKFDSPWAYWRPDVFYDVFSSKVFKPLPSRAEVFSLLRDYFRTVNLIFPLYHEETFMQLVEWQYTQQTCDDAARWASINIILALAYEYRFSNSQKSEKDREKAWLYYKNAVSVFPELVLRRTDLLSVQALLGMALFLRGNSGSQSTVSIVTAAIRSSHRMGLHREIPRTHLPQVEQEQRKKVFWIAYILDQNISIRLGNAPTQHFDDFDVEFPTDETMKGLMRTGNKAFFPQVCRIAVIRSRIYNQFYSARALENKSTTDICEVVHKFHAELQEWKNDSHFDTLFKQRGAGEDFLAGFASAGLFLLYYNSLIMIHRVPLLINYMYQSRADSIPEVDLRLMLNQSSSSAAICVQAARDTLKLVNNLPWGDIAWIWSLLYYVFLAVMTVFTYILRNSQQPAAKDDLQSLNMAATFFATLVPADGPCNYARFMTRMSTTFERIARTVLERDQKVIRPPETKSKPSKPRTTHKSSYSQLQSTTSPNQSTSTNIDIPNLEGLPPINSSGYVVRESPSPSPSPSLIPNPSTSPTSPPIQEPHSRQQQQQQQQPLPTIPQFQPHHHPQHPYTTESITSTFPLPFLDEASFTFPQPELWQIPLTADWEIGNGAQFLSGIFGNPGPGSGPGHAALNGNDVGPGNNGSGHGQYCPFQGNNCVAGSMGMGPVPSIPVSVPVPVSSVPMMDGTGAMGYGYGPSTATANRNGNGSQHTGPVNHASTMWMGGDYGNRFPY